MLAEYVAPGSRAGPALRAPLPSRPRGVSWLPQYHDMGLIVGLLAPLLGGYEMAYLSPAAFAREPLAWPRALATFGAHWSAAPDFAFALCAP